MTTQPSPASEAITRTQLRELLLAYRRENWKGIQTPETQAQIVEAMLDPDARSVLSQVSQVWKVPDGALVLDVGSGVGGFVVGCRQLGYQAFGIEPDRIGAGGRVTSIQIAAQRAPSNVFAVAVGEALPFADQTFDLVTLNQVVEHVSDQMAVLRESVRVLRRGGAAYIACPNYLRFYEPHYKIFWFPLFPKVLGRLYLRLRGRDPVMLSSLYYTTNRRLRRWLHALGSEFQVLDLHEEQFNRKCAGHGEFQSASARLIRKLVALPIVGGLVEATVLAWFRIREGGCEMVLVRRSGSQ
jgi:SAM-dependent methyltransferase